MSRFDELMSRVCEGDMVNLTRPQGLYRLRVARRGRLAFTTFGETFDKAVDSACAMLEKTAVIEDCLREGGR